VVADADVLVPPAALTRSLAAVADGAAWAMPHGDVYRLDRNATNRLLIGSLDPMPRQLSARLLERRAAPGPWGGGLVVLSLEAWETSGGIDPRFEGWGGEDEAWARALTALVGPCVREGAPMFHLWHERQDRRPGNRGSEETERLAGRYLDAARDPEVMAKLVAEHQP
jgi:hypothetical protein